MQVLHLMSLVRFPNRFQGSFIKTVKLIGCSHKESLTTNRHNHALSLFMVYSAETLGARTVIGPLHFSNVHAWDGGIVSWARACSMRRMRGRPCVCTAGRVRVGAKTRVLGSKLGPIDRVLIEKLGRTDWV
jgi:hypothetical protein